jgi:S-DNA-T family DNA segregation ATPase FtsK/SpoIIIE
MARTNVRGDSAAAPLPGKNSPARPREDDAFIPKRGSAEAHPPSQRLLQLFAEARWLLFGVLAAYLLLVLLSYHHSDPGWSRDTGAAVLNKGGRFGAWVADILFYLFGLSVFWLSVLCLRELWLGALRLRERLSRSGAEPGTRLHAVAALAATLMLLLSSSGLEAMRFWDASFALPYALPGVTSGAGGAFGDALATHFQRWFGFTGGMLALLGMFFAGFSIAFRVSWLEVAEQLGAWVERVVNAVQARRDARIDREAGALAAAEREQSVEQDRVHFEEAKEARPVHIEPQIMEVPKAARVEKEKQKPLFAEMPDSSLPAIDLLDPPIAAQEFVSTDTLEFTSRLIEKKLKDFSVEAVVVAAYPGPVITRYEIEPAVGVKGSQVVGLAKDLARALTLNSIRVVETIPGKNTMGLELPNPKRQMVKLSEILGSQVYNDAASLLTLALGKDIAGKPMVADLAKMPHLLVAGTTGSGKSVGINAMILSLLYKATPEQVRLILIDPKMLELSVYEGVPHLLAPVVTDMRQAGHALNWCVAEMERRYKLMSTLGVRNLASFNNKIAEAAKREEKIPNPFSLTPDAPEPLEKMPTIVIVIDELADMMMVVGKKVEELIARIAQKARAAGIHLILATQRPSVDVITGLIKANIPTRISFQVSSKIDSRTILDQQGAEALLGQGDMLWLSSGTGVPVRVHGAFVADDEVHRVVQYLKTTGAPNYEDGILEGGVESDFAVDLGPGTGATPAEGTESDALYDQAVAIVLKNRRASISLVQRHLRIGYNRAARLLEQMEQAGMVSAMQSNGNREILVPLSGNE